MASIVEKIQLIPENERDICEVRRLAADEWSQLEHAADTLERMKDIELERRKNELQLSRPNENLTDAFLKRKILASNDWSDYIKAMIAARKAANDAKADVKYYDQKKDKWITKSANMRQEMRG